MILSLIISLLINFAFAALVIFLAMAGLKGALKGPLAPWFHKMALRHNSDDIPKDYLKYVRNTCSDAASKGLFSATVKEPDNKEYPAFATYQAEEWFKTEGFEFTKDDLNKTYLLKW